MEIRWYENNDLYHTGDGPESEHRVYYISECRKWMAESDFGPGLSFADSLSDSLEEAKAGCQEHQRQADQPWQMELQVN